MERRSARCMLNRIDGESRRRGVVRIAPVDRDRVRIQETDIGIRASERSDAVFVDVWHSVERNTRGDVVNRDRSRTVARLGIIVSYRYADGADIARGIVAESESIIQILMLNGEADVA